MMIQEEGVKGRGQNPLLSNQRSGQGVRRLGHYCSTLLKIPDYHISVRVARVRVKVRVRVSVL
jgi:hypothetical protein